MRKELDGLLGVGDLRRRIEEWRTSKRHIREHMPEELWGEAVELARVHGISRTARNLGIGDVTLRRRLDADSEGLLKAKKVGSAFVELETWGGTNPLVIEIERKDGCRMKLQVAHGSTGDALILMRAFTGIAG